MSEDPPRRAWPCGTFDPTNQTTNPTTGNPTTTTDPSATDPATTAAFIIMPDGGNTGTIECDVFKQDCDPGEKCTAWAEGGGVAWNASKCVMVTGE